MSTLNDTDTFLVNRSNQTYKVNAVDLMATIEDDDLMLVNRSDQTYKITGLDVKNALDPNVDSAPDIDKVILTELKDLGGTDRFNSQEFESIPSFNDLGYPDPTFGVKATLAANLYDTPITDIIQTATTQPDPITTGSVTSIEKPKYAEVAAYGTDRWVAAGNGASYSLDNGVTWTYDSTSNLPDKASYNITYGGGKFLVCGSGWISSSPDGVTWTDATGELGYPWVDVAYGNGKYIAVSNSTSGSSSVRRFTVSTDGVTFSYNNDASAHRVDNVPECIQYAQPNGVSTWVVGGKSTSSSSNAQPFWYSLDEGVTWNAATVHSEYGSGNVKSFKVKGLQYKDTPGQGIFVAVGVTDQVQPKDKYQSTIYVSEDGQRWKTISTRVDVSSGLQPNRVNWTSLTYANGLFVAYANGGFASKEGTVAWSADGYNWKMAYDADSPFNPATIADSRFEKGFFGGNGVFLLPNKVDGTSTPAREYVYRTSTAGLGNTLLTLDSDLNFTNLSVGQRVTLSDDAASGTISTINSGSNQLELVYSEGTWSGGTGKTLIGKTYISSRASLFAKLDSDLNVVDLVDSDPGFQSFNLPSAIIKFPAILQMDLLLIVL